MLNGAGCRVVWWLAPSPHSKRVPGSTPSWGLLCVEFACSPRVCVGSLRVLRLAPTLQKHACQVNWCLYQIVLRSECVRLYGCLSLCGPVMDWRPVQGVSRLSPDDCWDRLQPPHDLNDGLSGYRKWMDGWMLNVKPLIKLCIH